MKKTMLCTAILAIYTVCTPAFSDEISDLKAEIAAQKQAAEAQKARLDALEKSSMACSNSRPRPSPQPQLRPAPACCRPE